MNDALTRLFESPQVERLDDWGERVAAPLRQVKGADRAMYLLSEAANHSILWHSINAVDAAFGDSHRRRAALRRSVILGVEQALVNGPLKMAVARDRPVEPESRSHQLRTPRTSSFPSGHASAAACAATLLTRDHHKAPLWWGLALAVSWSRIHVGIHHPSDVAAGLVTGRLLARSAAKVWPPA